jgi:hypothetical protein
MSVIVMDQQVVQSTESPESDSFGADTHTWTSRLPLILSEETKGKVG